MVFYNEPVQTVLVTMRGHTEVMGKTVNKENIITIDWHMPISFKPALYAISVGKNRFSLNILKNAKSFVINFIDYSMKETAIFCGRNSGIHIDKFKKCNLEKIEAEKIDCPIIKGCCAYLECEVVNEIEAGDHIIFIGKIIGGEHNKEGSRLFHTTKDDFVKI